MAERSDRVEAVLYVLNGHIPASAMERHRGRDLLITKSGIGIDVSALAYEIAALLDMRDAAPR